MKPLLLTDTAIDPATVQAYLETDYRVFTLTPLTLRIGEAHAGLDDLHRRHGVQSSTFITAWNPLGEVASKDVNEERQRALAAELQSQGFAVVEGIGQHPSDPWAGEHSLLVLGATLETAKALGHNWQQNAIVWCSTDAVPQLVLLR